MKKFFFFAFALVAGALAFHSCDNGNDPEDAVVFNATGELRGVMFPVFNEHQQAVITLHPKANTVDVKFVQARIASETETPQDIFIHNMKLNAGEVHINLVLADGSPYKPFPKSFAYAEMDQKQTTFNMHFGNDDESDTQVYLVFNTLLQPEDPVDPSGGGDTTITNQYVAKPFTIAAGKKIVFSQGNLQYNPARNEWRFAALQYDTIGVANQNAAPDYDGWLDLFGWGTGKNPTLTSKNDADYSVFEDWGQNPISNGGNTPNQWRTMTTAEWRYLIMSRDNAWNLFGFGRVAGIGGFILLPDEWALPAGLTFYTWQEKGFIFDGRNYKVTDTTVETDGFAHNVYTAAQWMEMEKAGAVFFPAAGERTGTVVGNVNAFGYYYHANKYDTNDNSATIIRLYNRDMTPDAGRYLRFHGSVRLAQDLE